MELTPEEKNPPSHSESGTAAVPVGKTDATPGQTGVKATGVPIPEATAMHVAQAIPTTDSEFDKWLEKFYAEAGREVTLAYTTLNQMKNWAVLIVGAVLSAVTAVQKLNPTGEVNELPIFVGAVIAYVFTLRFFVRAILCYINLSRWNNIQNSIVALKVAQPSPRAGSVAKTAKQLKAQLLQNIDELYFKWLAPSRLTRGTQLLANLKLGFGLLIALPLFFAFSVGLRVIPHSHFALGLTTFAVGYTIIELVDFFASSYFDTPDAAAKRHKNPQSTFPTPTIGIRYLVLSLVNVFVSLAVAYWPEIVVVAHRVLGCP
jgi:hypothetical protein